MSVVTNLLIHVGFLEDGNEACMTEVAGFFEERGFKAPVNATSKSLPRHWYGNNGKSLEAELYIAAYNRSPLRDFEQFMRQVPWVNPQVVQVIVKEQEDVIFRTINIGKIKSRKKYA